LGIVYTHPQSRVVTIAHLCGVPLHPTQLYSIIGNLIIAAVLMRLWFLGLPPLFLAGLYLLFSSIARFVEEGFRGEPQTIRFAGLPIYQWLAIILSITGIILTSLPGLSVPQPHWGDWNLAAISLGFAGFTWFAMGVDFPESHWRFSRLT
jgi:phosphatidylglycerol:prolipoprotein diacylglycerol transferase